MTALWIAAAVLTVVALAFMVLPLARRTVSADGPARSDFDLTVYKDQLKEVERDQDRGVLSEDQAIAARTEIERRMLAAADEQEQELGIKVVETRAPKATMGLMVAILILMPLGAFGLYSYLGSPTLQDYPLAARQLENQQAQGADRERARQLLAQLEQHLEENPDDIEGWNVLVQVYENTGRFEEAANVYARLVELTDRHPQALAGQAEAMVMVSRSVTPEIKDLLEEVREKDPTDPRPYFFLGLDRRQNGDLQGAIDEYLALLKVSPADADWVPQIKSSIEGMVAELGVDMPDMVTLPPEAPVAAAPEVAPGPTQEQMQQAQQMSEEERQAMIRSMVQRLADKLKDNPDDLEGWQRLAQAYRVLGDQEGLAEAQAQIERLSQ